MIEILFFEKIMFGFEGVTGVGHSLLSFLPGCGMEAALKVYDGDAPAAA